MSSVPQQHSGQHPPTKGRKKRRVRRQNSQQMLSEPTNENVNNNAVTSIGETKGESDVIVTYDSNSGHSTINDFNYETIFIINRTVPSKILYF